MMNHGWIDYYALLEVSPTARTAVIEAAWKAMARDHHPDRNSSSDATLEMQAINQARHILLDEARRAAYDSEYLARTREDPDRSQRAAEAAKREAAKRVAAKAAKREAAKREAAHSSMVYQRNLLVAVLIALGGALGVWRYYIGPTWADPSARRTFILCTSVVALPVIVLSGRLVRTTHHFILTFGSVSLTK